MAITLGVGPVSGGNVTTGSTITLSLTGTTAGRSIVVGIAWRNSAHTISSITCTSESNLTLHGSATTDGTARATQFASLANITTGGDKTIVITFSTGAAGTDYNVAFAVELAGGDTSSFFDATAGATGTSTAPSTSITTSRDNNAVLAVCIYPSGGTPTAGSGYTLVSLSTGGSFNGGEYDVDVGTAGSKTANFTIPSSVGWVLKAAAFNALDSTVDGSLTKTEAADTVASTGTVAVAGTLTKTEAGDTLAAEGIEGSFVVGSLTKTEAADTIASAGDVPVNGSLAKAEAGDVTTGSFGTIANTAAGSGTLPLFTLSASSGNGVVATLPSLTISASGVTGAGAALNSTLPVLSLAAVGTGENVGALALSLPALTLFAGDGGGLIEALPALTLEATAVGGTIAILEAALPSLSLVASGGFTNLGALSASLSSLQGYGTGVHGVAAEAAIVLPSVRFEGAGNAGEAGAAALVLPLLTISAAGHIAGTGTALLVLPNLLLSASGAPALPATYRTWVVNLKTRAVTEYTGFTFNSYANFDGRVLAASASGIFELNSATVDDTTDIDAVVRTGKHAYETSYLKRVPRLYLSYSAPSGDLEIRTITSEDGRRRYLLRHNGVTGVQQRRVPVGKGPKSKYWQFELTNRSGSDFELDGFIVYPQVLGVRTQ